MLILGVILSVILILKLVDFDFNVEVAFVILVVLLL